MTETDQEKPGSLAEANPLTLDQLFQMQPDKLSDDQMKQIVAQMREARKIWEKEDRDSKAQGRRPKTSKGLKGPKEPDLLDAKVKP